MHYFLKFIFAVELYIPKLYSRRLKSKHNHIIICIYSRRW